jgi:hypothetical protein
MNSARSRGLRIISVFSTIYAVAALGCQEAEEPVATEAASLADMVDDGPVGEPELLGAIAALDAAIADLRSVVVGLERDIARVEGEHAAKTAEVDRLVRAIEARRREVEDAYERDKRNALLFCAFGYCPLGAVSLVMAFENDSRLKQLTRELEAAKQQQAALAADLQQYGVDKAALGSRLGALRATEAKIVALLSTTDTAPHAIDRLARRADRMEDLHGNLGQQAQTLEEVRTLAFALSARIDTTLVAVAAAVRKAEALAEASRRDFYKMLEILTAGDPNAAAEAWLDRYVAAKTKEILKRVGWDPDGFINQLIARAMPGQERSYAANQLRAQLRAALRPAA